MRRFAPTAAFRSAFKFGTGGGGLLDRIRAVSFAMLGFTAAAALALVAFIANQGWPDVGALLPVAPVERQAVGNSSIVSAPALTPRRLGAGLARPGGSRVRAAPALAGGSRRDRGSGGRPLTVAPGPGRAVSRAPQGGPQNSAPAAAPTTVTTPAPSSTPAAAPTTTTTTPQAPATVPTSTPAPTTTTPTSSPQSSPGKGEEDSQDSQNSQDSLGNGYGGESSASGHGYGRDDHSGYGSSERNGSGSWPGRSGSVPGRGPHGSPPSTPTSSTPASGPAPSGSPSSAPTETAPEGDQSYSGSSGHGYPGRGHGYGHYR